MFSPSFSSASSASSSSLSSSSASSARSSSYPSPMLFPLVQQAIFTKRLPKLYLGALLLIAILALSGQAIIQILLSQQAYNAHVISLAANQETLSQRVSKDALAIAVVTDPQQRAHYLDQFTTVGSSWNRVQLGLQKGDPGLQLPKNTDPVMTQLFTNLQPQYLGILDAYLHAEDFVTKYQKAHPTAPFSFPVAPLVPYVNELLAQEEPFAQGMQLIVAHLDEVDTAQVTTVRITEIVLCSLTVVVLLGEAFFIFRPTVRKLKHNATNLQSAEQKLAQNATKLQERNEQLQLALQEVWALRRRANLPVKVVQPGVYYVLNSTADHYYTVKAGPVGLVCDCYVGQQAGVCSHITSAAAIHAAMERSQRRTTGVRATRLAHYA